MRLQDDSDIDAIYPPVGVDAFGMPENLLGPHAEEFFQILGRIVALAAVLEQRLLTLYELLARQAEARRQVRGAGEFIRLCRDLLKQFGAEEARPLHVYLDEATKCLTVRHGYVHSLWPAQAGDEQFAWRANLRDLRAPITFTKTLGQMQSDLTVLIDLLDVRRWNQLVLIAQGHELHADVTIP